jgi:hypothetical protein
MNRYVIIIFCGLLWSLFSQQGVAQDHSWSHYDTTGFFTMDSVYKKGYTLLFINKDSIFDPGVKRQLINTFFIVYPEEAERFNPQTVKKVTFIIDPHYKGVAATANAVTRFNPEWFRLHPEDIDVVTHEVMHIVQDYHTGDTPGWLTEGIADYARYVYGVNNRSSGWTMPDYNAHQSYKNAYRITARFLVWLSKKVDKSIVVRLNASLRDGTYTEDVWKRLTGKTVDQLWRAYSINPILKLHYR